MNKVPTSGYSNYSFTYKVMTLYLKSFLKTSPEHASLAVMHPASVFLITNEYELVTRQQNQRRLLREFPAY